ncbi:hypothetical protein J6590_065797 [Homalodisca vitripennis]|nr:hypothetical protein J6590_065797 [Homalodisca vitripennis]
MTVEPEVLQKVYQNTMDDFSNSQDFSFKNVGNSDGGKYIIEYSSRKFQQAESHGYLKSRKFKLYTDNSALQWLHGVQGTKLKLTHWAVLAGYDFDVIHIPGTSNQAVDGPSKNPTCQQKREEKELPEREIPP